MPRSRSAANAVVGTRSPDNAADDSSIERGTRGLTTLVLPPSPQRPPLPRQTLVVGQREALDALVDGRLVQVGLGDDISLGAAGAPAFVEVGVQRVLLSQR